MAEAAGRRGRRRRRPVPSVSTLLYLFANRLVPRDTALTMGVEVPCAGVKVQRRPLAEIMFAAAFFSLRQQSLVQLSVGTRKVWFVTTGAVTVTRVGEGERSGLEGVVLQHLTGGPGDHVYDIIRRWLPTSVVDPWDRVIEHGVQEAAALGYLVKVDAHRGRVGAFLLGDTRLEGDCERIAALGRQYERFATHWQYFCRSERDLCRQLMKACAKAIESRRDSSD